MHAGLGVASKAFLLLMTDRQIVLLMTEGVAMHEGEVLFPNQIWHHGRTVHVTEHRVRYLLSDPLLSEAGLRLALTSMIQRHFRGIDGKALEGGAQEHALVFMIQAATATCRRTAELPMTDFCIGHKH
jgi:hypothetical protein